MPKLKKFKIVENILSIKGRVVKYLFIKKTYKNYLLGRYASSKKKVKGSVNWKLGGKDKID